MNNLDKRTKKGLRRSNRAGKIVLETRKIKRDTEPYCPKCGAPKSSTRYSSMRSPSMSTYRECLECKELFDIDDLRETRKRRKNQ